MSGSAERTVDFTASRYTSEGGQRALDAAINEGMLLLRPPVKLTVSAWADKHRVLGPANAEPGPWRTSRVPYLREPMDCFAQSGVQKVTLMWAAQTGKTEIINNVIGYYVDNDPMSVMIMQPTQSDLKTWLETKLNQMIRETKVIASKIMRSFAGTMGNINNQSIKSFPGGFLMFSYAGSANTLRGRSAPIILCDEVDGYDIGLDGDQIELLWQRAATFGSKRKLGITSTPTIKNASKIEAAYQQSDMRRFYLPCNHCGESFVLKWKNVKWDDEVIIDVNGREITRANAKSARYECEGCKGLISDGQKIALLSRGEWRAERPFNGHAGFHLSELYSPFRRWADIVQSFLDKKAALDLQSFVNISLAETWEEDSEGASEGDLMARRERFIHEVPRGVLVLTAGVDIQRDRVEIEVVGWGIGEDSWSIDYIILPFDTAFLDNWFDVQEVILKARYETWNGGKMGLSFVCIDSGFNTQTVYNFINSLRCNFVRAIKGRTGHSVPFIEDRGRRLRRKKNKLTDVELIGVDNGKSLVLSQLRSTKEGAGYCRFPRERDDEYFLQLTSEKMVTKYDKGMLRIEFKRTRPRNEALDCRVYALAALRLLIAFSRTSGKKFFARIASKQRQIDADTGEVIGGEGLTENLSDAAQQDESESSKSKRKTIARKIRNKRGTNASEKKGAGRRGRGWL